MGEDLPRKVYRVIYTPDHKPYVAERMMVARNGSWYTTQSLKTKSTFKENGNYWSDTVTEALQREAHCIMHRFTCPSVYPQRQQLQSMSALIEEAIEWGVVLGATKGLERIETVRA